jgi:hypothetical protein
LKNHAEAVEQAAIEAREREEIRNVRTIRFRYVEKLNLNRKGHSATFKSVTRLKRENNNAKDKIPAVGHYTPKFELQYGTLNQTQAWKDIVEDPKVKFETLTNAQKGLICKKLM